MTLYDADVAFRNREGRVRRGAAELREELAPFAAARASFDFEDLGVVRTGGIALMHTHWTVSTPGETHSLHAIEVARRQRAAPGAGSSETSSP